MNCLFVIVVVASLATVNAVGKCDIGSIQKKIKPIVDAERKLPAGCDVDKKGMYNFLKPTKVTDDHAEKLKWRLQCRQYLCKIDAVGVEECEFDSQGNRFIRDVMDKFEKEFVFRETCPFYKRRDEQRAKQEKRDAKSDGRKDGTTVKGTDNSSIGYSNLSYSAVLTFATVFAIFA